MDAGISYRRDFIILEEENGAFRLDKQKTLTGYVKIEDRGIKAKVSIYIQNVNEGNYTSICICVRDGKVEGVECGNVIALKQDKVDITFETMSKNLFSSNYEIDDVVGICIISDKKTKVLEGFKSQKYQYIVNQMDNPKEKEINLNDKYMEEKESQKDQNEKENNDENKPEYDDDNEENKLSIGNEYAQKYIKDDHEEKQDDKHEDKHEDKKDDGKNEKHENYGRAKKEDLKYLIFEANPETEERDDIFIPFQNANIKANWRKNHVDKIQNSYAKKVLLIPYMYNLASSYGHYIIGETDKYFIVGIPSRFSESNRYMARYSDIAEWVRMSNKLKNYGYWMFVISKEKGNIIYLE